jgi:hypothetical protein
MDSVLPCVDTSPRRTIDEGEYVYVSAVRHVVILFGPIPPPPKGWNSKTGAAAALKRPSWPDLPRSYRLVLPSSPECAVEVVLARPGALGPRDHSNVKRFAGVLPGC